MTNLAGHHFRSGQITLAHALLSECATIREQHYGPSHPDSKAALDNLRIFEEKKFTSRDELSKKKFFGDDFFRALV